jgi:sarcosine oxidase subunit gamma
VTGEARRRTALAPHVDALAALGAREVPLEAQVSVRVERDAASGLGLPIEPNTWRALDGREALWLGPDEWLVTTADQPATDVIRELESRLGSTTPRSVVDASANRVVLELARADRLEMLSAGCGLDLHPRSWREGMCAQTLLANAAVLLQERGEATRVLVRPSFAGHIAAWLGAVG